EDLRRLLDHEHGCLHRFGRSPDGDHAVILEKDHAWEDTRILDKAERLAAHGLAEIYVRVGIGDEEGRRAAANDIVREKLPGGEFTGPWGTEDLVGVDGVGVANEADSRKAEGIAMKQRLDGRFLGGGFHTTCEKLGVHLFVAKIVPVECLQERSESA